MKYSNLQDSYYSRTFMRGVHTYNAIILSFQQNVLLNQEHPHLLGINGQSPGRFLSISGRDPRVSTTNQLHAYIFRFSFIVLRNIL
jgi:hypothetical protein